MMIFSTFKPMKDSKILIEGGKGNFINDLNDDKPLVSQLAALPKHPVNDLFGLISISCYFSIKVILFINYYIHKIQS
jgi:hypothetical protein